MFWDYLQYLRIVLRGFPTHCEVEARRNSNYFRWLKIKYNSLLFVRWSAKGGNCTVTVAQYFSCLFLVPFCHWSSGNRDCKHAESYMTYNVWNVQGFHWSAVSIWGHASQKILTYLCLRGEIYLQLLQKEMSQVWELPNWNYFGWKHTFFFFLIHLYLFHITNWIMAFTLSQQKSIHFRSLDQFHLEILNPNLQKRCALTPNNNTMNETGQVP